MRRDHMKYLLHQRDRTMREGIRTKQHSLAACVECHASTKTGSVLGQGGFCQDCHSYAGVKLDCFECHAAKPERLSARARP
jgi:[DsrC]-trisulfide reductase subunit J